MATTNQFTSQNTPPLDLLKFTVRQLADQNKLKVQRFRKGHDFIIQGDKGDKCYLVVDGHVNVYAKGNDNKEKYIISRLPNELIGESALVQRNSARTATVRVATETASLIEFTRDDIIQRVKEQPRLTEAITTGLLQNGARAGLARGGRMRASGRGRTAKRRAGCQPSSSTQIWCTTCWSSMATCSPTSQNGATSPSI